MNYTLGKSLRLDFSRTFYDEFLDNARVTDVRSMSSCLDSRLWGSITIDLSNVLAAGLGSNLSHALNTYELGKPIGKALWSRARPTAGASFWGAGAASVWSSLEDSLGDSLGGALERRLDELQTR